MINQLFSASIDSILIADANGLITQVNPAAEKMLGYAKEELIGKQAQFLYANEAEFEMVSLIIGETGEFKGEIVNRKKSGKEITTFLSANSLFNDEGEVIGMMGISRDITANVLIQNQYEQLVNTVPDVIYSTDMDGNFTYVNDTITRVFGYDPKELIGTLFTDIIHKSHLAEVEKHYKNHFENRLEQTYLEFQIVKKDGSLNWIGQQVSTKFNLIHKKKVEGFYGVVRDIDKQKAVEQKLIEREKTLHQITETLSDVFYLYNIVDNKYEYISSNCETVLGAPQEFFYAGKSHTKEYGYKDDTNKLYDSKEKVDAGEPYDIDYRIIVDNEIRWINEKSFPIRNEAGIVISNSGICRDITDLKKANETIYRQNIEIGASILYAKRLQDSVLPSNEMLSEIFPDSFVLYKPKDVVSGDFYVVDYLTTNEGVKMPTFIVGDCTGHGIPGAVLSLMCNVLIRESFTRSEIGSPGEALDFVRVRLSKFFEADNVVRIRDGMDVAFGVLNKEKDELYFSGANNSCVVLRGEEIIEYKGDRQHIGYTDNPKPFTNHTIHVKKGDLVFIYTDGYMDQFGGVKTRKYTKKRLHKSILSLKHLPMTEIGDILEYEFFNWKMDEDQTDDITILGIRVV
jgi:PAS domain S-box-containing protein